MRPALNGLLDGLSFRGRLLVPTRAWTLTSISLVTRRRKSPFPQTVLESQTPRLRPAPLLRLLLPLLTSELLHIALFFFYAGLRTRDICNVVLNEYPIFYLITFTLFFFFITAPLVLLCLSCPGSMAIWPCLSRAVELFKTELLRLRGLTCLSWTGLWANLPELSS